MRAPAARNLPALLQLLRDEGFSGTVRVSGHPGGTIHLRDGLVGAIETPGAPTVTSTLLASGRIGDEDWLAACAEQPDADRLGGHLVATGLIGAAELEVVRTAAVFDGAFAMALSPPGERELGEREPVLVAEPGVEPRRLTEETSRRMSLLSRLWGPPSELTRVRPVTVAGSGGFRPDGWAHAGAAGSPRQRQRTPDTARHRLLAGARTVRGAVGPRPTGDARPRPLGATALGRHPAEHRTPCPDGRRVRRRAAAEDDGPAQTQTRRRASRT
ncbi:hypothetical protein ACWC09_45475 [Streptomyces sp. NPDC001617]